MTATNDTGSASIQPRDLSGRIDDPTTTIVDVRPLPAYNGWRLRDEARGGHIPGATSFPAAWLDRVDDAEIRRVLDDKRITPDRSIVALRRRRRAGTSLRRRPGQRSA